MGFMLSLIHSKTHWPYLPVVLFTISWLQVSCTIASSPTPVSAPPLQPQGKIVASDTCPEIVLYPISFIGNSAIWVLENNSDSPVRVRVIQDFQWPQSRNGNLEEIHIDWEVVWEGPE